MAEATTRLCTRRVLAAVVGGGAWALNFCAPAFAQAVGRIPTRAAEDAFGVEVEGESVGLYDADDARGASPIEAGNVRIEGLYAFVNETNERLSDSALVAIGPQTLDATHPAPSGVVDFALRRVEDESFVSASATLSDRLSMEGTLDAGWRGDGPLSFVGGLGASVLRRDSFGDDDFAIEAAGAVHWDDENIQASVFAAHGRDWDREEAILYQSGDGAPPPRISRRKAFHQPFVGNDEENSLVGLIARVRLASDLVLRGGLFHETYADEIEIFENFELEGADGLGRRIVTAFAPSHGSTSSGEVRLEKSLQPEALDGVVFATLRARQQRNRAGGAAEVELDEELVPITLRRAEPRPEFDFEDDVRDAVDQTLVGLGARLNWSDRVELSLGLQYSWYRQRLRAASGELSADARDNRLLGNVSIAARVTPHWRVYAGYAEGLEELGAAPPTAVNANVALAAAAATQSDAAIVWRPSDTFTLILGAFELRRPFADVDDADVYGVRGEARNRGFEASGVWRPNDDVNVIAGVVVQEPLLTGDGGGRGAYVPGMPTMRALLEVDVRIAAGLYATVSAEYARGIRTNAENTFTLPERATLDLGLRYEFEIGDAPIQIQFSIENVTDEFYWDADGDDAFTLNNPRTFALTITADF